MPRFFVPTPQWEASTVRILGDDAYHIARSLRMAAGEEITVCDMRGWEHTCRLLRIRDEECVCEVLSSRPGATEPEAEITLYMGYPKGDKLETVVQKAVELGACRIVPFLSSRCVRRPQEEREDKQLTRLRRIAAEAAKQCGRCLLPAVEKTLSFPAMLAEAAGADLPLFCYEGDGTESLREVLEAARARRTDTPPGGARYRVSAVVGCEGGFSAAEAEAARGAGLIPVGLGPRILRCETAPVVILSAILYAGELK